MEILLGAIAEAIMSILLEDITQRTKIANLREKLRGDSPAKLAIQRALGRAYESFNQNYPELTNSFFDEHYLQQPQISAELAKILTPNRFPDKTILTQYWKTQFGTKPSIDLEEPLSYFLDEFENQVKSEPLLKDFVDSRALEQLYTISVENKDQTVIQKEIRDLLREILDSRSRLVTEPGSRSEHVAERVTGVLLSYQSSSKAIADMQKLRRDVEVLEERITLEDKLTLLGAVVQAWIEQGKSGFELEDKVAEKWGFDSWKRANVAKYLVGRGFLLDETPDYISNTVYTQVRLTQEGFDWHKKYSLDQIKQEIEVNFSYSEITIRSEEHFYQLEIEIYNGSKSTINNYKLEFTFPDLDSYPRKWIVYGRSTESGGKLVEINPDSDSGSVEIINKGYLYRVICRSRGPLFPQESVKLGKIIGLRYRINDDVYDNITDFPPIKWNLFVDNRQPEQGEVPLVILNVF